MYRRQSYQHVHMTVFIIAYYGVGKFLSDTYQFPTLVNFIACLLPLPFLYAIYTKRKNRSKE